MAIAEIQKQTNANIQEKANLIWEIATHLVGFYKPHEYGKVILPMTVLKRFDDALAATKDQVLPLSKHSTRRALTVRSETVRFVVLPATPSTIRANLTLLAFLPIPTISKQTSRTICRDSRTT